MKNVFLRFFLLGLSLFIFSGCDSLQSNSQLVSKNGAAESKVGNSSNTKIASDDDDKNSPECVRAKPVAIIKKEKFPNATFKLEKNKNFPFEYLGYETVQFDNGDKLLIENIGCENFTLIFRFETNRFSGKSNDVRFWYKKAGQLISEVLIGINEPNLISDQVKGLNSYVEKNKRLKYNKEIIVSDEGIKENVKLEKVKFLKNKRIRITLHFNTGPL
jgi:hypothetical protein